MSASSNAQTGLLRRVDPGVLLGNDLLQELDNLFSPQPAKTLDTVRPVEEAPQGEPYSYLGCQSTLTDYPVPGTEINAPATVQDLIVHLASSQE